jgi:cAMP-dependent protein kinase regulator
VAHEFAMGRTTGEMALESSISLADHMTGTSSGLGQAEFSLDDEPKLDVVHAVASAIGSSPLLSELDSDLVKHLIDAGTLTRRPPGEAVFKQGDVGTSLFLILQGEVAVVRDVAGETPRELARLRAGAFFGEMALITNSARSATVRVEKAADLLEVSRRAVRAMIEKEPRVLKLLMRFFRARLVGTLLQTSPVFEPFSREDRKKLVASFRLRELGAGHAVFEEGSKAEGLFVLLAGRLEVLKGLDKVLGQLSPGDVFGEMSLLDGSVAMATVRAKTRSWVLLLPRHGFEDLAARYPQIRGQLRALADTRRARNERESHTPTPGGHREGRVEPI